MRGWILTAMSLLSLPGVAARATPPATFQGLGSLAGAVPGSVAADLSTDGSVVVGGCPGSASCAEAWRWTQAGGMQGLGFLPGETLSFASATSGDGTVVFGISGTLFRWTSAGMVDVGAGLPSGGSVQLNVPDCSGDGLVAVGGFVDSATLQGGAWRWTSGVGNEILEPFTIPNLVSFFALSADGTVIAGASGPPDDPMPFIRTDASTTFLPELPNTTGCQCGSEPGGISGDGLTVVGDSHEAPFRWSAATGTTGIGFLPGAVYGKGLDASADGSVVVGVQNSFTETSAFIWTEATGALDLRPTLEQLGVDLTGWTLTDAVGVSSDGTVIAGNGTNPSGDPEAWIAFVPSLPVPQVPAVGPIGLRVLWVLLGATGGGLAATASRRRPTRR